MTKPTASMAAALLGGALCLSACGSQLETASIDSELAASQAVARAEEWVSAQLHYCQAANHQRDFDDACSTFCNRTSNPDWDPYRSDCSGLISWAWGLPAPGRVTWEFAPFTTDISSVIDAAALQPADAVNNSEHVMLFKAWVTPGQRAVFIEEPGCATAVTHAHELTSDVSINGSSITVAYNGKTFTAIRYRGFGKGGTSGGGSSGCVAGGLYCGGDKVSGDANTLYRCNAGGAPSVMEQCSAGCEVRSGQDDACRASSSGGNCVAGGVYCGGDKVSGDANTLYRCNGSSAPSVVEHCSAGCVVRSGQDDVCAAGGPSGGNCVAGGLYCGGDKVSGNANTLYRCNGSGTPSTVEHCAAGCLVRAGQDDACAPSASGNNCVSGGLYCGGDKVSGDRNTLYRCNGPGTPSVVSHCASGCLVRPGENDACR